MQANDLALEFESFGFDPARTLAADFDYEALFGEPALPVALRELSETAQLLTAMQLRLSELAGHVTELEWDRLQVLRCAESVSGLSRVIQKWADLLGRFEQVGPLEGAGRFLGEEGLSVLATMRQVVNWGNWLADSISLIAKKKSSMGLAQSENRPTLKL